MVEGFGSCIRRAVRVDEDHDWSSYQVDYSFFKRRLLVFSERRAKIRNFLREGSGTISSEDFEEVLSSCPSYAAARRDAALELTAHERYGNVPVGLTLSVPQQRPQQESDASGGATTVPPVSESVPQMRGMPPASGANSNTSFRRRMLGEDEAALGYVELSESASSNDSSLFRAGSADRKSHTMSRKAVLRRISTLERTEITRFLDEECHKSSLFYKEQLAALSKTAANIKTGFYPDDDGYDDTASYSYDFEHLGNEILELFSFVTINVVTVRQILIRYDAFVRTFEGTPMSHWYMKKARNSSFSWFWYILCHEELVNLAISFKEIVQEVHGIEEDEDGNFKSVAVGEGGYSPTGGYLDTNADFLISFSSQVDMFKHILAKSQRSAEKAASGQIIKRDNLILTLRSYFLLGAVSDNFLGLQPKFLTMRGKSLNKEMKVLADWRVTKMPASSDAWSVISEAMPKMGMKKAFPLILNLVSISLFMMNYYIVEPSSTKYVNALGCNDAMSGLLIGAMPWAVLVSVVIFSYWTNYSFRTPLLVAGCLLITGNILYASAYGEKSIAMALGGRFITGLGGTKVINRRYVADTTPIAARTAVNAAFGMALTVGVALGPATAVRLDVLNSKFDLPYLGTVYLNGMTGTGYLMATLWTLFTVVVALTFEEPEREGLKEQEEKEKAASKADPPLIDRTPSQPSEYVSDLPATASDNDDAYERKFVLKQSNVSGDQVEEDMDTIISGHENHETSASKPKSFREQIRFALDHITGALRICMFLFFAKMFTLESMISVTSALTKNRYGWQVQQVGTLGCINGLLMIPLSILIGCVSQYQQDRVLMTWLVSFGALGFFILIDISDLISAETDGFNEDHILAVGPARYVTGYFITFASLQAFDSVIASTLSKVIPTALASGTLNSGLLTTLVGTLGSACGDVFIAAVGFINLRQLMNMLFIPSFCILIICSIVIRRNYDILAS